MKKKLLSFVMVLCTVFLTVPMANAESIPNNISTQLGPVSQYSNYADGQNNFEVMALSNLILRGDVSIYLEANRTIRLVSNTTCTDIMDKVGFKDITLQRWNGSSWINVSVWSAYRETSQIYTYDYRTTVTGGYYYRITLNHYAENGWWIFADKQEVYNETSSLWVG